MKDSIQFGSQTIVYTISFSERRTLGITITPDIEVLVKAPQNTSIEKIKEKVNKKAPWIIKQQSYFLSFHPKTPARKYVSGETHLYLGRQYLLKVTKSNKNEVKYKGRYIEVLTNKKEKAKELTKQWYRQRAKIKFVEIAEPLITKFKKYNVEPTVLYIQDMPTRWGSCTPKGKIILNPELIKAPRPCIEYVIIHELCHLLHHDHTRKFIDLQTREMPDWEKWKNKLERLLA
jgi:predicted metal-dependent hydrolase